MRVCQQYTLRWQATAFWLSSGDDTESVTDHSELLKILTGWGPGLRALGKGSCLPCSSVPHPAELLSWCGSSFLRMKPARCRPIFNVNHMETWSFLGNLMKIKTEAVYFCPCVVCPGTRQWCWRRLGLTQAVLCFLQIPALQNAGPARLMLQYCITCRRAEKAILQVFLERAFRLSYKFIG